MFPYDAVGAELTVDFRVVTGLAFLQTTVTIAVIVLFTMNHGNSSAMKSAMVLIYHGGGA